MRTNFISFLSKCSFLHNEKKRFVFCMCVCYISTAKYKRYIFLNNWENFYNHSQHKLKCIVPERTNQPKTLPIYITSHDTLLYTVYNNFIKLSLFPITTIMLPIANNCNAF